MDNLSNLWFGKKYKRKSRTYESVFPDFIFETMLEAALLNRGLSL